MTPKRRPLFGIPSGQWFAVFAIIALMYAILYPVFQKSRPNPHGSCHYNLSKLGAALTQYEQDADGYSPPGVNVAGNGWAGQLYASTKSKGLYKCPDDSQEGNYISYAENRNVARKSTQEFVNPAGTVGFYEFTTLNCDYSKPETVSATGITAPQDSTRHNRPGSPFGLNFLLADGHVKYLTPGQVSGGASAVPPTHKGSYLATFAVK